MHFFQKMMMSIWLVCAVHALDRQEMADGLVCIHNIIQSGYAPLSWKREFLGWEDATIFARAQELLYKRHPISLKDYHHIVREYLGSLHDHHVAVLFFSTESATLPFSVQYIQGRYFVDWVDTKRLPPTNYDIQVGDELLWMDGLPVEEVAASLSMRGSISVENAATDQAILAMGLTMRLGVVGDLVPQGTTTVTFQRQDEQTSYSYQLMWRYQPEWIAPLPPLHSLWSAPVAFVQKIPSLSMLSPLYPCLAELSGPRPGSLGAKKSFVPELGEIIWSSEEGFPSESGIADRFLAWIRQKFPFFSARSCSSDSDSEEEKSCWYSYIYRSLEGRKIGYVRIPSYDGGPEESLHFGELMNFLEERTDALVIDQVNNPGGYVRFLYDLCSMVAMDPLITPRHRIQITQSDVMHARKVLDVIYDLLRLMDGVDETDSSSSNLEIEDVLEEISYQNILFYKEYHEFIIKEWEKGHLLTDPTHIEGVDYVNPHPLYRYRKPLLVLTNCLDFSGADFLPCILQDNKRAVIFGSRTAGAGGCVATTSFMNRLGVRMITYTSSIAERWNGEKIENLGVSPDISYEVTREDLLDGYEGYRLAVNRALESVLSGSE